MDFPNLDLLENAAQKLLPLLMWFYLIGLMLLGAEINSEIQAAMVEKRLKEAGTMPLGARAEPGM
jgi:membrane protein